MKKIIITILLIISISEGKEIKYNTVNYPYDLELIINYIKNRDNFKPKTFYEKLYYINSITNNIIVKEKIKEILEKTPFLDTTTYSYALINPKDLKEDGKYSIYYMLIYNSMNGNMNKLVDYPDKKINKVKNKGVIYSIKAFNFKDTDDKKYNLYKNLAKKSLNNDLLYYYILFKYSYIYEDYASALEYIQHIKNIKSYRGINEDIVDLCLKGSEKYLKNKNYPLAWIMSKEGTKASLNLDHTRNIDTILQLKKNLVKSSKKFLEKENRKKDLFLYIIKETENSLKVK